MGAGEIAALTLLLLITQVKISVATIDLERNIPEDGKLNFTQLAEKYGRQVEVYHVTTEDGYIIQLHRLVGPQARPVLLWHGLFASSDIFILGGDNSISVALNKADQDVWLGNSRGNKYSRQHISLNPDKDKKFWDFSFHEMGYYDLPAALNFIFKKTGQEKLNAIGHSQGTTIFYVLGSMRPEYNEKVQLFISMAPIAFLSKLGHLAKIFPIAWPVISDVLSLAGINELFRDRSAENELVKFICSQKPLGYKLCYKSLTLAFIGADESEIDEYDFSVLLGHFPAGTSRRDVDHLAQLASKKKFCQFDHGPTRNLLSLRYGAVASPEYKLSKVTMPIALVYGKTDNLATADEVHKLYTKLPNVVYYSAMEPEKFNHADFILGENVNVNVNPLLMKLLKEYGDK